MNCTKTIILSVVVAVLIGAAGAVFAAEDRGFEIAARSDRTDLGFGDSKVELTMTLRNAAGQESSRSLRITTLEKPDESVGDKSLVVFDTPRDIEGTALLSHAKILDPDDQWLYLPALKRVKRLSSANKSGRSGKTRHGPARTTGRSSPLSFRPPRFAGTTQPATSERH